MVIDKVMNIREAMPRSNRIGSSVLFLLDMIMFDLASSTTNKQMTDCKIWVEYSLILWGVFH